MVKRILIGLGLLIVAVVGATGIFTYLSVQRAHPDVDGTVALPGLEGEVTVIRDGMGVPHIYATSTHDLVMAQGYVHAQDRFWQMDFWRHIGAGRTAEMFGEDALEADLFIRTLGWERIAQFQYETSSDEIKAVLEAYAEGVNAYLAERSPSDLSFEYTLLELLNHGYDPAPWTPVNTLTWGQVMAWDLSGNLGLEIERAMLLGTPSLTQDQVQQLYPPYPGTIHPYIVESSVPVTTGSPPLGAVIGARAALQRVADRAELVAALGAPDAGPGIGSNSWVVSGEWTLTGAPILANDTHLGIQMPSIWYQASLHCEPVGPQCPFDVAGFTFPGAPGVVIGHNADIAWGFTNLGPDVMDLYIERVDGDRYEVNGEMIDMEVREEIIEVAGAEPVTLTVRSTRHGPIISDVYEPLEDFDDAGIETPDEYGIALRWTALDPNPGVWLAILLMNQATNWDQFRLAAGTFDVPAQNLIYADTDGNIGYQMPGKVPIRAGGDGTVPVPGWTDDYEWTGFIPFEELPTVLNPPSGYIVTANNAVIDGSYPHFIALDQDRGYRARRIVDLILSNPDLPLVDHGLIQFDTYNLNAERLVPFLLAVEPLLPGVAEMQGVLGDWDLHNDAGSAGAAAFAATWRRILELTFHDELPEDFWPEGGDRWFLVVSDMLDDPTDPLWQIVQFSSNVDRDRILMMSMEQAYADLVGEFGEDAATWRWGDLHTTTFENATLGATGIGLIDDRFNRGPYPASGSEDVANATGWTPHEGFEVDWLPSQRMLVDLADLSRSLAIHTTGQSGHIDNPHYADMIPFWLEGRYAPMWWTRSQVEEAAEATLVLVPG